MKRLTDKRLALPTGVWQEATREKARELKEIPVPSMQDLYYRLSQIEDILCDGGDEYDLDRLSLLCNQRMTMRDELSQRFSLTAKIPLDRLRELVEMLGYLPVDGMSGHVYRDGNEWYFQDMTEAVFNAEFNQLERMENGDQECRVLPIRLCSTALIYTQSGLMYKVTGPGELSAAMTATRRFFREPATLGFRDYESALYLSCLRPEIPYGIWTQLEEIDWAADDGDGEDE